MSKKGIPLAGAKQDEETGAIIVTFAGVKSAMFNVEMRGVIPAQLHAVAEFLRGVADQLLIQGRARQAQQQAMDTATLAKLSQNLKKQ
jgi:hypothetical protein